MRGQRPDRCVGAAATVDRDMRLLPAADFRIGPSCPVELALVVERRRLGPGPAQQGDILSGTAIAGLMVGPVAVFGLIGVAAAGNDVHRQTAIAQLVESGQLAGGDRRRHEPRSMRQQEPQPLGHRRSVRPNQEPIRRIREIADQHAVEAGPLMKARRLGNHARIKRRSRRRDQLRRDPRRDPADHLHRHSPAFLNRSALASALNASCQPGF